MEDKHFDKVFYFCCSLCASAFLFDLAVCFYPVPSGGQKYADILIGSINTGALTAAIQYLLGGNPKGKSDAAILQTGDQPIANTNPIQPRPTDTDSFKIGS